MKIKLKIEKEVIIDTIDLYLQYVEDICREKNLGNSEPDFEGWKIIITELLVSDIAEVVDVEAELVATDIKIIEEVKDA